MELNNLNKSRIKLLMGNLIEKSLFSDVQIPESVKALFLEAIGKTRYRKFVADGKLNWPIIKEYKLTTVYNFLNEKDKEMFVDLCFRLNDGNFFHPKLEYKVFNAFDAQMNITKNYIKNISLKFGIKEIYLWNYVKKVMGMKVMSESKEKEVNLRNKYKENLNNFLADGFVYTDTTKKYIVNKNGISYKLVSNRFKISKITPTLRENNMGSKYFIVSMHSKQIHLHRLIAEKFLSNNKNYRYVRAKDGNFLNLNISNFEWVKYPATTRVLKNFSMNSDTWLGFIIKNFEDGIEITNLTEILSEIANEQELWSDNHNKASTIYATIEKYSQSNKLFPIFNIYKGERNIVLINKKFYNEYIKKGEKNEVK